MMSISRKKTVEISFLVVSAVTTIVMCSWFFMPELSILALVIETLFLIALGAFGVAFYLKGNFKEPTVEMLSYIPRISSKNRVSGEIVCQRSGEEDAVVAISIERVAGTKKKNQVMSPKLQSFNVLVVDDNLTNQLLVCSSLEKFGCKICKAFNGVQAVKAVTKDSFDLILMDLKMPVMNGLAATKKIREIDSLNINTPIVALSPTPESMNKQECKSFGMNGCLAKPVSKKSVRRLLELLKTEQISWQKID